jgi:hypothetical protein
MKPKSLGGKVPTHAKSIAKLYDYFGDEVYGVLDISRKEKVKLLQFSKLEKFPPEFRSTIEDTLEHSIDVLADRYPYLSSETIQIELGLMILEKFLESVPDEQRPRYEQIIRNAFKK